MKKDGGNSVSAESGSDSGEDLPFEIMDRFVDCLIREMAKPEAVISADDVKTLAADFKSRNAPEYLARFRDYFDECLSRHEEEIWDQTRKRPFDRMVVKRFSHLFPAEGELDNNMDALSRRILPGFFISIKQMAGPELFEQCQTSCKAIIKSEEKSSGNRLQWEKIYNNAEANELVDDVLVVIASYFENFEKRCEWMHDIIGSHLASPEDYAFEGEATGKWLLGMDHIHRLLQAMFGSLQEKLADDEGRRNMENRYGRKSYLALEAIIKNINAAFTPGR